MCVIVTESVRLNQCGLLRVRGWWVGVAVLVVDWWGSWVSVAIVVVDVGGGGYGSVGLCGGGFLGVDLWVLW